MYLVKHERRAIKDAFDKKLNRELRDLSVKIIVSNSKNETSWPKDEDEEKRTMINHVNECMENMKQFSETLISMIEELYSIGHEKDGAK